MPIIVELDYLDWSVCAGGHHITGHIVIDDPYKRVELHRELSLKEAKELSETQGLLWKLRVDRTTNRFETLADIERAAIKWCSKNLEKDWLLQAHNSYGPYRPIGAGGEYVKLLPKLKKLAEDWDKVRDTQTNEEMAQSYAKWTKLTTLK